MTVRTYTPGLVSVITPTYRAAQFVAQTIDGVCSQTHQDWELLVVDDCSPDDTVEVVERLTLSDARVKLLRQERNAGPAMARNSALSAGTGQYVAFCDSDDVWLPEKLERQLSFMRRTGAAFSYTAFRRMDEAGGRLGRLIRVPRSLNYAQLLCNTAIATSTVILDRSVVGDVRMTKTFYDDLVLWLSILKVGVVAQGLEEDLMRYRVVRGSWSRSKTRSAGMVWRTFRDIERLSVPRAAWCLANYGVRGVMKYARF